ncbi:MAG: gamma-glutamyltransferase [Candidatus Hydrogenedentota bacterium]|nr:MAG: gamma-glutamyltransferase [Candidatus Hydrogenedentota bacterium]
MMRTIQKLPRIFVSLLLLILGACDSEHHGEVISATGTHGVVVAAHQIAADIGLDVLKSGGNAVDAAVATGLACGVVDQFNSGIGGGGFIIIRMTEGTVYTIDGRETAPAAATRDMYLRDGEFDPDLSQEGPLAVGVPGILAAYAKALQLAGTRTLTELISPSIEVAERGFELDSTYILRYNDGIERLKDDPPSARIYLRPDGSALNEGDILTQLDLAKTYRRIADEGPDYFYRGEFAERLAKYMSENGGLITLEDMAGYSARVREPIVGRYRDCEIIGMAPPSSGGVHIVQILNMLEASGLLREKTDWDMNTIFWTSRFMRKAFEDRALHLGDTDFYPVPIEHLPGKEYADSCVNAIMNARVPTPEKPDERRLAFGHTTNFCVIDQWGNAAVVNQTVNLTYGAKITLPGTGVILNNEMDDFSAQPGVPNAFGLIGSEANSIAPGKRPLSSMSPTIVVRDGKPVLMLGGAGGPVIITAVLEMIVDVLDFGNELAAAQSQPRFHHQFRPDVIVVEDAVSNWTRLGLLLKTRKPAVRASKVLKEQLGRVNAIAWSEEEQAYVGVPDPRGRGGVAGY